MGLSLESLSILCNVTNESRVQDYFWDSGTKTLNICTEFGVLFLVLCLLLGVTVFSFGVGSTVLYLSRVLWLSFVFKSILCVLSLILCIVLLALYFCTDLFSQLLPLHGAEYGFICVVLTFHTTFWIDNSLKRPVSKVSSQKMINFAVFLLFISLGIISYQRYVIYGRASRIFYFQLSIALCFLLYLLVSFIVDVCYVEPDTEERHDILEETRYVRARPLVSLGHGDYRKGILSQLLFWWTNPLLLKGSYGQLRTPIDLFQLSPPLTVQYVASKVERKIWEQEVSLGTTLLRCFGFEYFSLGVLKFFGDNLVFAGPILLNLLVNFIENRNEPIKNGYIYAALMCAASLLSAFFGLHFGYRITRVGVKVKAFLVPRIYKKLLSVSQANLAGFSSGELMNLMSTDTDRILNFCPSFHAVWSLPVQLVIALYLLYREVGISFLAGLAFAVLLVPVNWVITKKIGQLSTKMMFWKDARVQMITELLAGIRVVKTNACENEFSMKITALRQNELKYLKARKYLDAVCVYLWAAAPTLIALFVFVMYSLLGYKLTAAKVFTTLSLMNILIMPLNAFPWVLTGIIEAWVSLKRVQHFLRIEEIDYLQYYRIKKHSEGAGEGWVWEGVYLLRIGFLLLSFYVFLHNLRKDFKFQPTEGGRIEYGTGEFCLERNHTVSEGYIVRFLGQIGKNQIRGQLIGIVGPVGSGKSSFLAGILAELHKVEGEVNLKMSDINSGFALVTQEAWLQHGTVRENICFGKEYEKEFYEEVVKCCALLPDFQLMPYGDHSEIGEQGVTLSGGQKIRLTLARAVYQDLNIYLLDDPFASLDAQVGKHIFNQCIMKMLTERNKAVLLVTHQIQFLQNADFVLKLSVEGSIEKCGSPSEVLEDEFEEQQSVHKVESQENEGKDVHYGEAVLMADEWQEVGTVRPYLYWTYAVAIGAFFVLILAAFIFMQGTKNGTDWFLAYWVDHQTRYNATETVHTSHTILPHLMAIRIPYVSFFSHLTLKEHFDERVLNDGWNEADNGTKQHNETTHDVMYYLTIYGILASFNSLFTLIRAFAFAYGGIKAAKKMHKMLLNKILLAPICFFDRTPVGRIVNRFSNDIYAIDETLPFQGNILITLFFSALGSLVMICYGLPWFIIAIVCVFTVYYYVQKYYRHTTCELKRINNVSMSPIYSHFNDTINGIITIRALRAKQRFCSELCAKLTLNLRAQYSILASTCWLGIRMQLMGVFIVTSVVTISVLQHQFSEINPGLVGLAVSYSLAMTNILNGLVQYFTETEKEMVSVERVHEYITSTPTENYGSIVKVPKSWPSQGLIEFHDVTLTYDTNSTVALNSVSFAIEPAKKVGIVGRTGSGKSSVFQALLRAVEINTGVISVDGVNISHVDLHSLRKGIALIPQHPFLFSGTLRDNLDFGTDCTDDTLFWAIKACSLDALVQRLGGLDGEVGERGSNLSLGERQLLCLARALLRNCKIVCIDEATAHVDTQADNAIQKVLRRELEQCTVLTIAHRLQTVVDYDQIIVLDKGTLKQIGTPATVLAL